MLPQENCQHLLHALGWSPGETSWRYPDGSGFWQVDASRDDEVVIARAATQTEAWAEALRMAGVVQQSAN